MKWREEENWQKLVLAQTKVKQGPILAVLLPAYQFAQIATQDCQTEIVMIGESEQQNGTIVITKLHIFEQEVSGVHCEPSQEAIGRYMTKMMQSNENPSKLNVVWHSHGSMGTFWSPVDEANIENHRKKGYWIYVESNHKGEIICRVDFYEPMRLALVDIPLHIIIPRDPEIEKTCHADIKNNVKAAQGGIIVRAMGKLGRKLGILSNLVPEINTSQKSSIVPVNNVVEP